MVKRVYLVLVLSLGLAAQADEAGMCDKLDAIKKDSQQQLERYTFTQFTFDNAAHDLAIIVHNVNLPAQIKQVTFGRGQAVPACYFKPLAIAQGGENAQYWGWHLLWTEPQGLFYARMDGQAWVSSNPKRLTKLAPINPHFKLDKEVIAVTWQETENGLIVNMQGLSNDEGRSWDINTLSNKSDY